VKQVVHFAEFPYSGPCMGLLQHQQIGGSSNGPQHGLRAWAKENTGKHDISWTYLYQVCGVQAFG